MPYGKRLVDHSHVTRVPILRLDNPSEISSDEVTSVNMRDHSLNKTKCSWFNNMFQNKLQNSGGNNLTATENSELLKNLLNQKMVDSAYPVYSTSEEIFHPIRQSATMNTEASSFHPAIVTPTFGSFVPSSTMSQQVYIPKMTYCNFNRCYQHKFKQKYLNSVAACNLSGANHKKYFHKQFVKQCDKTMKPATQKKSVQSSPPVEAVFQTGNDEQIIVEASDQCDGIYDGLESAKVSGEVVSNWLDLCTDDESDETNALDVPDSWDEDEKNNPKENDERVTNANITVKVGQLSDDKGNSEDKNVDCEKMQPRIKIQINTVDSSKSETEDNSKESANQNNDKSFILFVRKENKKCRPSVKKRQRSKAKKKEEEGVEETGKENTQKEPSPKCQNSAVSFMFGFNQTSENNDINTDESPTHSFYMTFEDDEQFSDWSEDDECSDENLSDSDLFCPEFASPLNLNLICSVKQPEDTGLSKQLKEINLAWQVQLCRKSSSSSLSNVDKTKKSGKKVHFADNGKLAKVHPMITWAHAYQEARKGPWRQYAIDHERFQRRIEELGKIISPVLLPEHRSKVYGILTES